MSRKTLREIKESGGGKRNIGEIQARAVDGGGEGGGLRGNVYCARALQLWSVMAPWDDAKQVAMPTQTRVICITYTELLVVLPGQSQPWPIPLPSLALHDLP